MQIPEPSQEHQWLQQLVGEWECESTCSMGPDQPEMKSKATQVTKTLGSFWILSDIQGEMPDGGIAHSLLTLGYDPEKKRFVGSFVSSCMTYLWPYNGSLDAAGKILTLDSEGPSFAGDGGTAKYQDIIEIMDKNHYQFRSQCLGPDGKWQPFMVGEYYRKNS